MLHRGKTSPVSECFPLRSKALCPRSHRWHRQEGIATEEKEMLNWFEFVANNGNFAAWLEAIATVVALAITVGANIQGRMERRAEERRRRRHFSEGLLIAISTAASDWDICPAGSGLGESFARLFKKKGNKLLDRVGDIPVELWPDMLLFARFAKFKTNLRSSIEDFVQKEQQVILLEDETSAEAHQYGGLETLDARRASAARLSKMAFENLNATFAEAGTDIRALAGLSEGSKAKGSPARGGGA